MRIKHSQWLGPALLNTSRYWLSFSRAKSESTYIQGHSQSLKINFKNLTVFLKIEIANSLYATMHYLMHISYIQYYVHGAAQNFVVWMPFWPPLVQPGSQALKLPTCAQLFSIQIAHCQSMLGYLHILFINL